MSQLILIRHGQSLWNAANKFTGWVDVPLSRRGRAEAAIASCRLANYTSRILPHLLSGENVLIAAHGNSLRSIIMVLEQVSEADIPNLELGTAVPIIYEIDPEGIMTDRLILNS